MTRHRSSKPPLDAPSSGGWLEGRCGECLLYGAIHGMTDGLVLIDPMGRVVHLNRAAQGILGLVGKRCLGVPFRSLVEDDTLRRFWRESQREDRGSTVELQIPAGSARAIRASVSPCVSHLGGTIGRAVLLRDITSDRRVHLELSAEVARRIATIADRVEGLPALPRLTSRERDVLGLLGRGLSNAAIARELRISPHTVGSHLKKLYVKLGVRNRAGAAALSVRLPASTA